MKLTHRNSKFSSTDPYRYHWVVERTEEDKITSYLVQFFLLEKKILHCISQPFWPEVLNSTSYL